MRTSKRILAVDDNPVNLGILEEILSADYLVDFAQSGAEAIRIAARQRPVAILLDVMMPGMDGLETCRRLRQMAGLQDVVIVMVSAKAMPSECEAGMRAGADGYVTKPFDETDLLEMLRQLLPRHSERKRSRSDIEFHEPLTSPAR